MSAWPVTLGLLRALAHKLKSVYSYHVTGAGKSPSTPWTLRAQITPACGVTCCRSDILIPCGFSGVPTIPSAAVIQTETEGATLLGSSPPEVPTAYSHSENDRCHLAHQNVYSCSPRH